MNTFSKVEIQGIVERSSIIQINNHPVLSITVSVSEIIEKDTPVVVVTWIVVNCYDTEVFPKTGDEVYIKGSLKNRRFVMSDGNTTSQLYVEASEIKIINTKD